jgi:hypothetical protein
MGHVYLALDPNIDRKVAIKIFLPLLKVGVAEQWELRQRFVFEARAAGQLNHRGIVTIFDADTDPDTGLSYLVMEWVNGPSLDDLIRESGPLAIDRSLTIVEEVAVALDAAHRQGLVHRDVKPANILLENSGRAKVTDFGIAKLASMSITTTGWIPGSPFYMSPEQIRNENIDRRSDLYALGAVLYQCLTGALPFEAESLAALTHMILEIDPRPVRSINPSVSTDLAAVIDRALAKSPDDRFDSGREFAQALQLVKAGKFKPAARRATPAAERQDGTEVVTADPVADSRTGTIGLAVTPPDDLGLEERDSSSTVGEPQAARELDRPVAEALDTDLPPAEPRVASPAGSTRLAFAIGMGLLLVAVWSLRPVQSEPVGEGSAVARFFSLTPRFAADAPSVGAGPDVPVEIPEAVETPTPGAAVLEPEIPAPAGSAVQIPTAARPSSEPLVMEPAVAAIESPAGPAALEVRAGPAAPEVRAVPRPQPVVRATSELELVYRNRIKNAALAVFVDGKRAYAGNVATSPGFFSRTVGKNMWTSLKLTPGEHVVDVRVTGAEGKVDLVRQVTATFEEGQTHRLRVTVTPLKNLKLSWKESPSG